MNRSRLAALLAALLSVVTIACTASPTTVPLDIGAAPEDVASTAAVSETAGAALGTALEGTVYGDGVTLPESVPISVIYDDLDAFVGKRVRVEGMVTDVCEKKGCWIELASDREFETIRIKVEDGVIVFPVSARGQYAVAEGIVRKLDGAQTEEERRRHAEEHGETVEPNRADQATSGIQLDGIGAVIRATR